MAEPFRGEIRMFAMGFAPKGWALCDGQMLPVSQHKELFSLLGPIFGSNPNRTYFPLPDMRGRVPVHPGTDLWGNSYEISQQGGVETVTLQSAQMPTHTHSMYGNKTKASKSKGTDRVFAATKYPVYAAHDSGLTELSTKTCTHVGGDAPHNNMQPSLVINFAIALEGLFPPRS